MFSHSLIALSIIKKKKNPCSPFSLLPLARGNNSKWFFFFLKDREPHNITDDSTGNCPSAHLCPSGTTFSFVLVPPWIFFHSYQSCWDDIALHLPMPTSPDLPLSVMHWSHLSPSGWCLASTLSSPETIQFCPLPGFLL